MYEILSLTLLIVSASENQGKMYNCISLVERLFFCWLITPSLQLQLVGIFIAYIIIPLTPNVNIYCIFIIF